MGWREIWAGRTSIQLSGASLAACHIAIHKYLFSGVFQVLWAVEWPLSVFLASHAIPRIFSLPWTLAATTCETGRWESLAQVGLRMPLPV